MDPVITDASQASDSDDEPLALRLNPDQVRFVESIGAFYESYNVPRIGGRLLGLLLVTQAPLSIVQMAETLGVSRSSVTTHIRMLLTLGLVELTTHAGRWRDYYTFSARGWEQAIHARIRGMQAMRDLARQGLSLVGAEDGPRQKLAEMAALSDVLEDAYLSALEVWRKRTPTDD